MAQDIPEAKAQQVFFVDDDLIERLLRGDPAPVPPKPQRPALSSSLAAAIELASAGKLDEAVQKLVALHQLGRLEETSDLYNQLLPANPNSIDLLANLTALSLARKEEAKAKEMAERLFKIQPESRPALEGLAATALSRGDFSAAAQHCSQLIKVAGDSYEAWFNLGVAYHKTGRLEQAANAYREALLLRSEAAEANANLGAALQERGELAGAREAYRSALEGSPELPGALWNLAIAADREGNAPEAEKLLERLLAAEPGWQDASFRLGYLRLKRGEFAGAVDCFEACLKQRKDWPEALLNLGIASWKFGDLESAADAFRQVRSINPKHADALRYLAAVAIEQKNSSEAREIIGKLGSPPSPELQYNLGLLLQSTGDYGAAAECYRVTLQHKPEFAGAMINLGHALKAAGQEEEARNVWSQAVAADPKLAAKYFQ
jgi:tetratricopeptide (TPR) repeat protein